MHGQEELVTSATAVSAADALVAKHPGMLAGPEFGNAFHLFMESYPWDAMAAAIKEGKFITDGIWRERAGQCMEQYRQPTAREHVDYALMLADNAMLAVSPANFALADVAGSKVAREFKFMMKTDAGSLGGMLKDFNLVSQKLPGGHDGYMHGYIDCIIEHQGKYYIIDWKTNLAGPAGYGEAGLAQLVHSHNYHLQALLYATAFANSMARRPGWDDDQFGGVWYYFVRGTQPGKAGAIADFKFNRNKLQLKAARP